MLTVKTGQPLELGRPGALIEELGVAGALPVLRGRPSEIPSLPRRLLVPEAAQRTVFANVRNGLKDTVMGCA